MEFEIKNVNNGDDITKKYFNNRANVKRLTNNTRYILNIIIRYLFETLLSNNLSLIKRIIVPIFILFVCFILSNNSK